MSVQTFTLILGVIMFGNFSQREVIGGGKVIFVPCPHCGHRNRGGKDNVEVIKNWMLNCLPPCKKCKRKIVSTK